VTVGVVALAADAPGERVAEPVRLGSELLSSTLGNAPAERLVDQARGTLARRLTSLIASERARYLAPAAQWQLKPGAPDALRQAARRVDDLRFAAAKKGNGEHL
ncbi:MAG: hypothetical protein L0H31_09765, partial [Nocardioidaceae bacterium]|nr:hypothetical protein [Nocardioidaceae bacterium]